MGALNHRVGGFGMPGHGFDGSNASAPIFQHKGGHQRIFRSEIVVNRAHANATGGSHGADGQRTVACRLQLLTGFLHQSLP
jgi:hypothetical protein